MSEKYFPALKGLKKDIDIKRIFFREVEGPDLREAEAYPDDVIVCAITWEELMTWLGEIFLELKSTRLVVNLAKCKFLHPKVEYLGRIIGQGGVRPVPANI